MENKIRRLLIAALAVLTLAVSVPSALSYFSTYTRVEGERPIKLGEKVNVEESGDGSVKHIKLTADEESSPVFVRLAIFVPTSVEPYLVYEDEGWTKRGNYYEYDTVLFAGQSAEFEVKLQDDAPIERDSFDLIVIYEYTPAMLDDAGDYYADWSLNYSIQDSQEGGNG